MKQVLFVDDEPMILDGLRQVLHRQRARWQMSFAASAAEALELLKQKSFDVIVSDMRMPGMDGAALLQQIRSRYPRTARLILSGHSSRDELLRALPVAQQLLSKPCPPDALCAAVERVCRIQELIANDAVRRLLGKVESLPSLPQSYHQLSVALLDPDTSAADLAAIVERDTALTVKTLQLVNSAYFGLAAPTTSVLKAVRHIGVDLLRALVASNQIYGAVSAELFRQGPLRNLPERAMRKAQLARRILIDLGQPSDAAFAAGLMLDAGLIVLALGDAGLLARMWEQCRAQRRALYEVEREHLGATHAEVGASLLGLWGLPAELVELVGHHHDALDADADAEGDTTGIVLDVVGALVDAHHFGYATGTDGLQQRVREHPLVQAHLEEWLALAQSPEADVTGDAA
ncbi:MAG: HDOD domain-containing protein [Steroidobacteraceae bacterium]